MKKINIIFTVLIMICTTGITFGCTNTNNSESSESQQVITETTKPQPSMSSDEARNRAEDAIYDKFDTIHPKLEDHHKFVSWGSISDIYPPAIYDENTDSYTVKYSDSRIYMDSTFFEYEDLGYFKVTFNARVTVYSNGDTHIDSFDYDIVRDV